MKVHEAMGVANVPSAQEVGIEIEVEGARLPQNNLGEWMAVADDSLRGGLEYVLRKPLSLAKARMALLSLSKLYDSNETHVIPSVRQGVHIHINMCDEEINSVASFLTLYYALETVIVKKCGPSREGNLFCLRVQDAYYQIPHIANAFKDKNVNLLKSADIRYCAMNVTSLPKYGSLEFRAMAGTRDLESIYDMCKFLVKIKRYACGFASPHDVIEKFNISGINAVYEEVFGEFGSIFRYDGMEDDIASDLQNAIDFAYSQSWRDDEKAVNPFTKKKAWGRRRPVELDF